MLDLSKIEITKVDRHTLRGVLKFTVEITAPTDKIFSSTGKKHLLFRFFEKFYGEIGNEVYRLLNLVFTKCRDKVDRDELMRESRTLRELVDPSSRIHHDLSQHDEQITDKDSRLKLPALTDVRPINFREFL